MSSVATERRAPLSRGRGGQQGEDDLDALARPTLHRRKDFLASEEDARKSPNRVLYFRRNAADYDRLIEACGRTLHADPRNIRALLIRASTCTKQGGQERTWIMVCRHRVCMLHHLGDLHAVAVRRPPAGLVCNGILPPPSAWRFQSEWGCHAPHCRATSPSARYACALRLQVRCSPRWRTTTLCWHSSPDMWMRCTTAA